MGKNKAFIEINGERIINRTVALFREIFDDIIIVTNTR
jgi:molybdopterin-guanine dinucleotide biosynthesis protein A